MFLKIVLIVVTLLALFLSVGGYLNYKDNKSSKPKEAKQYKWLTIIAAIIGAISLISFVASLGSSSNDNKPKTEKTTKKSNSKAKEDKEKEEAKKLKLESDKKEQAEKQEQAKKKKAEDKKYKEEMDKKEAAEVKKAKAKNDENNLTEYANALGQLPEKSNGAISDAYVDPESNQTVIVLSDEALGLNDNELKDVSKAAWELAQNLIDNYKLRNNKKVNAQTDVLIKDTSGNVIAKSSFFGGFKYVANK
ncbi:hypothetical protein M3M35_07090 [Fructilactobacillus myrtifloralis]|uniref:DUF308 domain-containing protein n=1 Tax=Fructilactobacillus myrtifloralis TaxID=2940301 RepID=A0ABY5BN01_9LACO|nr:hypothetical protein [Fructilactobacillus myrtifloralis]USS85047.1 hypothetical protein M3M35_07090 [Fructilactobacillus myrtifloralis]